MRVLLLEDDPVKRGVVRSAISIDDVVINVVESEIFSDFVGQVNREKFDLIVVDLLVPLVANFDPDDITHALIDQIRNPECVNAKTPVVAITGYDYLAEEGFADLNQYDITVFTYSKDAEGWRDGLLRKLKTCIPALTYDFVIFCALDKEAMAYVDLGYTASGTKPIQGLLCREIAIDGKSGIIVTPPRMGLINAAITCTKAIELFQPKLLCMSGICAGIDGKAEIYDVIIPELCFQHDSGKWTSEGFIPEPYSVPLDHETHVKLQKVVVDPSFKERVSSGLTFEQEELPEGIDGFAFEISIAPASSGSAVVAADTVQEQISEIHRKGKAFEMEAYALYEAARQSLIKPIFFSAKSVVDNGNALKSDKFHRLACLISARVVYEIIKTGQLI